MGAAAWPAAFALEAHGAGRCRSAVTPHPPPARATHRHAPHVTAPARATKRPPAPGILSPGEHAVKGTAYGRVPPLRSGQTPDGVLPRQGQALAGRTGEGEHHGNHGWAALSCLLTAQTREQRGVCAPSQKG